MPLSRALILCVHPRRIFKGTAEYEDNILQNQIAKTAYKKALGQV